MRGLVPPARDNQRAAEFFARQIGADNATVEWVAVRPDTLLDGDVTEYRLHDELVSSIFKPDETNMANVAHFMCELTTDEATWQRWKGEDAGDRERQDEAVGGGEQMTLTTREFIESDLPDVAGLLDTALGCGFWDFDPSQPGSHRVALEDGIVIGFASAVLVDSIREAPALDAPIGLVRIVAVDARARRRGVATLLTQAGVRPMPAMRVLATWPRTRGSTDLSARLRLPASLSASASPSSDG